ncbi:transporter, small conductance mechanosensitive ion channel (MscS) family protein [delta proteobacterium NaphS2]|nr:transporter, small conductance mechanosensitive ion channel (MscS) family protein [delta proteobacterium NaphS2]
MSADLVALEQKVSNAPDVPEFEKDVSGIEESLKKPAGQLQQIKNAKDRQLNKLVELRKAIERENKLFEEISKPLSEAIDQFGTWRNDWLAQRQKWNQWQSVLLEEGDLAQLQATFRKANDTIGKALNIVVSKLNSMLAAQERAGNIQAKIIALSAELDALILASRSDMKINISPPMFSFLYFSQYSNELWYALKKGLTEIAWPDSRFFEQQRLNVFLHVFLSLFVIFFVYRNRRILNDSKRWSVLAARPISTGFLFSTLALAWFYEHRIYQDIWGLTITTAAGVSYARIIGALDLASWKVKFAYGLVIVLLATNLLQVIKLPTPLFRLYTVLTAFVALVSCWRWAGASVGQKDVRFYRWPLRAGAYFLAVIIVAEIWGKQGMAEFLFMCLIRSTALVLGFMFFVYMTRGFLEWLFRHSSLQRVAFFQKNTDTIIRRVTIFMDTALCGLFFLPAILLIWGVFDTFPSAIKGLLTFGFNVGSHRISIDLVIIAAGILYGSFLASWMAQKVLVDEVLAKRRVETGVRISIARLVHYVLIFIGFLMALVAVGFDFTKLTIILSALGIGVGFGLQNIVNNLVSGLILLFERPVRVGDSIEVNGQWAEIKKIGLRATLVQTLDQADVIIPNSDLVSSQVINWTLSNRRVRLIIPVGVAYGSDVSLVMETLVASAGENSKIAVSPSPQVFFLNFGESSLDFELRVWVLDADNRLAVSSELHQEIDRRFREAKIEISFPQRDLHLRSLDESVVLTPMKTTS